MNCLCGSDKFLTVHSYSKPDKYESWVGIQNVKRSWVRCMKCGFYMQLRNYDLAELETIYKKGYRDKEFRGESIEEAFERVTTVQESENERRFLWFGMHIIHAERRRVLDIGSGLGVWPYILKTAEYDVECVEENQLSINFLYENLGLSCFEGLDSVHGQYDTITLIHVLEHIEKPEAFLKKIKLFLRKGGYLFIEVPDSIEFTYLDKDHDEFNSCHTAFYNMGSLHRMVESCGYNVVDMHMEKTKARKLSRVMCLAIN